MFSSIQNMQSSSSNYHIKPNTIEDKLSIGGNININGKMRSSQRPGGDASVENFIPDFDETAVFMEKYIKKIHEKTDNSDIKITHFYDFNDDVTLTLQAVNKIEQALKSSVTESGTPYPELLTVIPEKAPENIFPK